jgi:hypothetical protein
MAERDRHADRPLAGGGPFDRDRVLGFEAGQPAVVQVERQNLGQAGRP